MAGVKFDMVLAQALAEYGLASMMARLQVAFGDIDSMFRQYPALPVAGGFILATMMWLAMRRGGR